MTQSSDSPPLVSVIIPVFNSARYLEKAVQSVLRQTFRDFELFIVDDGSTDESLKVARRLATCDPSRITVLQHPDHGNHGVAETRNLAVAQARGKYVAFLDSDDYWSSRKLEKQAEFMEAHPEIGLTFTKARIERDHDGRNFVPGAEELGNTPPLDRRTALTEIIAVSLNYIFSTVMVRTDALRAVGCFPEDLPFQSEDRLMVAKVSADHGIALVPETLCHYLAHGANYSMGAVKGGIVPAIFFDMRVRMVKWLHDENGKRDWARLIARTMLPDSFVAALLCSNQKRIRKNVLDNLLIALRLFPLLAPAILFACVRHSRIGAMTRAVAARLLGKKPEASGATATP
jgi:glycosyltransferase involved in cell wall biosynthesis